MEILDKIAYLFLGRKNIMELEKIIIWVQAFIILGLGAFIFFSKPKEKIVTKYETKYKTIVEEKLIEKECEPKVKILYKKEPKAPKKDNFLLAKDRDMHEKFTIMLLSKTPIKEKQPTKTILLHGLIEEAGYKSKFMLSADKKLVKNSYFKVENRKTKDTFTSPLCFESVDEGEFFEVKLSVIGGGVFCDIEEIKDDTSFTLEEQESMQNGKKLDEGEFMAKGFIEDISNIFKELNVTMPDINETKLKEILLRDMDIIQEAQPTQ